MPKEIKGIKEIEGLCVDCKLCVKECRFLQNICESPTELINKLEERHFREEPRVPYSCNLCDLCESICPSEINLGDIFLQLRQEMSEEGLGPLAVHKKFTEVELEWVLSDSFTLSLPDPSAKECHRVFFPGCNLAAYSPAIVLQTYAYLQEKLPGTGIILGCCGSRALDLGKEIQFKQISADIEAVMQTLGASEMIVACPHCYDTFGKCEPTFEVKSLYEIMAEAGLPEVVKSHDWTFSLHDSCPVRWEEEIQDSVRTLITRMGYQLEEMKYSRELTRCCGLGGEIALVDLKLARSITESRIEEAPFDMLTYCASCRESFATYGKPSLHILDLIFNRNWVEDRLKPANKASSIRRENQALLKAQLEQKYGIQS